MGNYDYCLAKLFPKRKKQVVDFLLSAGVKVAGGFIGKYNCGVHLKCPRNGYAGKFPAGKL